MVIKVVPAERQQVGAQQLESAATLGRVGAPTQRSRHQGGRRGVPRSEVVGHRRMVRGLLAGFGGEEEPNREQDNLGGPPDALGKQRFRARGLVDEVIGEGIEGELRARDRPGRGRSVRKSAPLTSALNPPWTRLPMA
jgi:hypothetical protein